jgi:hypothetical protein
MNLSRLKVRIQHLLNVPNAILAGQVRIERERGDPEDHRGPAKVQHLEPSAALRMMTHFLLITRLVERKKNGMRNAKEGQRRGKAQGPGHTLMKILDPKAGAAKMGQLLVLIISLAEAEKNKKPKGEPRGHREAVAPKQEPSLLADLLVQTTRQSEGQEGPRGMELKVSMMLTQRKSQEDLQGQRSLELKVFLPVERIQGQGQNLESKAGQAGQAAGQAA